MTECTVVPFGTFKGRADRALIVATGTSLSKFNDYSRIENLPGVVTIAVKQAINVFAADIWVTVDPNYKSRAMMRQQRPGTLYIAAVPTELGSKNPRRPDWKGPVESNVLYLHRNVGTGPLRARECLSEDPGSLNTGNSAWGALGIAYLMGAKKIGILGLDATQSKHGIGAGQPFGSLQHLPWLFNTALPQLNAKKIEVLNGSINSLVTCFPRHTIEEVLEWIVT